MTLPTVIHADPLSSYAARHSHTYRLLTKHEAKFFVCRSHNIVQCHTGLTDNLYTRYFTSSESERMCNKNSTSVDCQGETPDALWPPFHTIKLTITLPKHHCNPPPPSPLAFWLVHIPLTGVNIAISTDSRGNLNTNRAVTKKERF